MTQTASMAGDPWPYPVPWAGFVCPSCGTWYQGWHQCPPSNTLPPIIQNQIFSRDQWFEEYKKFYRKFLMDDLAASVEYVFENEFGELGLTDEELATIKDRVREIILGRVSYEPYLG